ncbi:MAG: hypothetical protein ACHQFZ_04525 [Acidimicrobiales bacterium]
MGTTFVSGTVTPASNLAMPGWSGLVTVIGSKGSARSARHASFCETATRVVGTDETNILTALHVNGRLPANISSRVQRGVASLVRDLISSYSTAASSALAADLRLFSERLIEAASPAGTSSAIGAFASHYGALEAACPSDFTTSVFAKGPTIGHAFAGPEYFCAVAPLKGVINFVSDSGAAALRVAISGMGRDNAGHRVYIDWVSRRRPSPGQPVANFVISRTGEVQPKSLVMVQAPIAQAVELDLYGSVTTAPFGQFVPCN